jgi:hypothetical protein
VPGKVKLPVGDPAHGNSGPGGPLPAAAARLDGHPTWCNATYCSADESPTGEHRSAPVPAQLDDRDLVTAVVQLVQALPAAGLPDPAPEVFIDLHDPAVSRHDDGVVYALAVPIHRTRELAWVLRSMSRQAGP